MSRLTDPKTFTGETRDGRAASTPGSPPSTTSGARNLSIPAQIRRYGAQDAVLAAVRGGALHATRIAELTGIPADQVNTHLRRLAEKGRVYHASRNRWKPVGECALAEAW